MKNGLRINAGRRYARALAAIFALATLAAPQNFNTDSKPPQTRAEALVETLHGVKVGDPFRWLEQGESREVRAWTDAQTAYTRRALDSLPMRAAIASTRCTRASSRRRCRRPTARRIRSCCASRRRPDTARANP